MTVAFGTEGMKHLLKDFTWIPVGLCNACEAPTFRIGAKRQDRDSNSYEFWTNVFICEECDSYLANGKYSPEALRQQNPPELELPPMREVITLEEYQSLFAP